MCVGKSQDTQKVEVGELSEKRGMLRETQEASGREGGKKTRHELKHSHTNVFALQMFL